MWFEEMGLTYLGPIDGHDIGRLVRAFKEARKVNGPVLLHILTQKAEDMHRRNVIRRDSMGRAV